MSTPQGPQDPRIPHQGAATPPVEPQQHQQPQQAQQPAPQQQAAQPQAPQPPQAQQQAPQQQAPQQQAPQQQQQPYGGYGYPQGQYQPSAQQQPQPQQAQPPLQSGYPYEVRPGFPEPRPYVPSPNEPDWSAMADRQEADRKRKRRMRVVIASVVVLAVAAAGTVVALTLGGKKGGGDAVADDTTQSATPSASASASTSASPSPSGSPTPSGGQATPTLQGSDLFAATSLPVNGQKFDRKMTSHATPCWKGTQGGLGPGLDHNQCSQIVLATYVSGKDAVTVGVLVFPTPAQATAVNSDFKGTLSPLTGKAGIPKNFCAKVPCAVTHAVHGRYLYTTIAGPNSGTAGDKDTDAIAAGQGIAAYALSRLLEMH
ncbi:hypothetical protein [Streptomyces sp. NPDC020917]|uniref:hypothetical protein n=1 Tax=Streptomyces sp. NPDC020917 TaxID=3365102 RepID=UPI0037924E7C